MDKTILLGVWVLVVFLLGAVLGPFISIWAVNTLFGLSIPYTFWTWLAALVLLTVFHARVSTSKSK